MNTNLSFIEYKKYGIEVKYCEKRVFIRFIVEKEKESMHKIIWEYLSLCAKKSLVFLVLLLRYSSPSIIVFLLNDF